MSVISQLTLGSILLLICAVVHLGVAARTVTILRRFGPITRPRNAAANFLITAALLIAFMASHTLHIYLWAFTFWLVGAFSTHEEQIYFALVSYTTLGFGDLTLGVDHRILGAMASASGILMYGMTAAFLVGYFTRILLPWR